MASLVLTVLGDDRPGLVAEVSGPVEAAGGSWQRGQLTRLAGKFAGVVLVSVPDGAVTDLERDLAALESDGLSVAVERTGDADAGATAQNASPAAAASSDAGPTVWRLSLVGQDRPGIVAEVSAALAAHDVGIDELQTDVRDAAMAGGVLFEAEGLVSVPADADVAAVRADLERLADELMVDLDLDAAPDTRTDVGSGPVR